MACGERTGPGPQRDGSIGYAVVAGVVVKLVGDREVGHGVRLTICSRRSAPTTDLSTGPRALWTTGLSVWVTGRPASRPAGIGRPTRHHFGWRSRRPGTAGGRGSGRTGPWRPVVVGWVCWARTGRGFRLGTRRVHARCGLWVPRQGPVGRLVGGGHGRRGGRPGSLGRSRTGSRSGVSPRRCASAWVVWCRCCRTSRRSSARPPVWTVGRRGVRTRRGGFSRRTSWCRGGVSEQPAGDTDAVARRAAGGHDRPAVATVRQR